MAARMTLRQEILAAFGCGAVVGGIVTAAVLDRQLRLKYNQIADDEIEHMKDFYREKEAELLDEQKRIASQPKPDLERITTNLKEKAKSELISEGEGYSQPVTAEDVDELQEREAEEEEERNAFVDLPPWNYDKELASRNGRSSFIMQLEEKAKQEREAEEKAKQEREAEEEEERNAFVDLPPWNYDKELASRNGDVPFIMHLEEYQQSECSHQVTITYFEGDDVLVDESDEVISKKDEVVGMENLNKFGYGSNDPNVVYVRNPKLDVEYEILRHQGHYAKEILGLEEEHLEHSAMPRRHLKFDDGT
jgi:hypothetical protein